jgi:hypothetical protein
MAMNRTKYIPALVIFSTSLACPTRPADRTGVGGDAGSSDHTTSGAGGGGGAGGNAGKAETDGAGGIAGRAADGGVGGVSGGAAAGGTGGVAGGAAGGAGGVAGGAAGGAGGVAGDAGTAGTGNGVAGSGGVKDGQTCSVAADCASRLCTPFYVDEDSDGYGTGRAVGFCGTAPPIGYAAQSGDCCDSASNLAIAKLIHPGADFQTTSAAGICGITWDYDCSGTIESNPQSFMGCTTYPACAAILADYPESACGTPIDATQFCAVAGPGCTMSVAGHPAAPIRCK